MIYLLIEVIIQIQLQRKKPIGCYLYTKQKNKKNGKNSPNNYKKTLAILRQLGIRQYFFYKKVFIKS